MDDEQSHGGTYEPRMSAHKSDMILEVRTLRKRTWTPAEKLSIVREGLQPGSNVYTIAKKVTPLDHDIADMDADAEVDVTVR